MNLVGVTGVIGSGKSRVARTLSLLTGWPGVSCDNAAAAIMAEGRSGWRALRGLDPSFLALGGEIDRAALRQAIFADPALRTKLDALLHPLVLLEIEKQLEAFSPQPSHALVEVPLLFEAGWQDMFSVIICVYAQPKTCRQRLVNRDGVSLQQAQQSLTAQMAISVKAELSDHVVDNSGSWGATYIQLIHLSTILA